MEEVAREQVEKTGIVIVGSRALDACYSGG